MLIFDCVENITENILEIFSEGTGLSLRPVQVSGSELSKWRMIFQAREGQWIVKGKGGQGQGRYVQQMSQCCISEFYEILSDRLCSRTFDRKTKVHGPTSHILSKCWSWILKGGGEEGGVQEGRARDRCSYNCILWNVGNFYRRGWRGVVMDTRPSLALSVLNHSSLSSLWYFLFITNLSEHCNAVLTQFADTWKRWEQNMEKTCNLKP